MAIKPVLPVVLLALACGPEAQDPPLGGDPAAAGADQAEVVRALDATVRAADSVARAVEDVLKPVALLRAAEEAALRRFSNDAHVARARALGVQASGEDELAAFERDGRLVVLEDSTEHWIVRELEASRPLVVPHTVALLEEVGRRFHARLAEMGLPPYRLEVTSVLRTPESQAALRRTNPNAAAGTSSHEFGTTVDLSYAAFAPPAELPEALRPDGPAWLAPYRERIARLALESVSARKSRELEAILGHVLTEMQSEGTVLVLHEQLQPVYHVTVGEALAGG